MNQRLLCSVCVAALLVGMGCRRHEPRQAVIDVPTMRGPECTNIVHKALLRVPGLDHESIKADLERRRIVLTYDSMIVALKNIEYAIVDAGFQANDIPADPEAMVRLPKACREIPGSGAASEPAPDLTLPLVLDHDEPAD